MKEICFLTLWYYKVYFCTFHARIYLSSDLFGINCATGMILYFPSKAVANLSDHIQECQLSWGKNCWTMPVVFKLSVLLSGRLFLRKGHFGKELWYSCLLYCLYSLISGSKLQACNQHSTSGSKLRQCFSQQFSKQDFQVFVEQNNETSVTSSKK